jgi:hypothetical protein
MQDTPTAPCQWKNNDEVFGNSYNTPVFSLENAGNTKRVILNLDNERFWHLLSIRGTNIGLLQLQMRIAYYGASQPANSAPSFSDEFGIGLNGEPDPCGLFSSIPQIGGVRQDGTLVNPIEFRVNVDTEITIDPLFIQSSANNCERQTDLYLLDVGQIAWTSTAGIYSDS